MSPRQPRWFVAIVTGALVTLLAPGLAAAQGSDGLWFRVGAVSEGQQHSLKHGIELGAGWDWHVSSPFAIGVGAGLARQGSETGYSEFTAHFLSFEGHVRGTIGSARVRPLAELGLGYYLFDVHTLWQPGTPSFDDDWKAPGVWLGIGAETRLAESLGARIGIAYHVIAGSIAIEGGNLEDYVASGVTLEYVLPRR